MLLTTRTNHHRENEQLPNSRTVAKFLSPRNTGHGGLRADMRRERVLVLDRTINAVSRASEAYVSLENADGIISSGLLLDILLKELEESILEGPRE